MLHALRLAWMIMAVVITMDTNRGAAFLAKSWWGIENGCVLHVILPSLGIINLQTVEGLP